MPTDEELDAIISRTSMVAEMKAKEEQDGGGGGGAAAAGTDVGAGAGAAAGQPAMKQVGDGVQGMDIGERAQGLECCHVHAAGQRTPGVRGSRPSSRRGP